MVLLAVLATGAKTAEPGEKYPIRIASETLGEAMLELARQTDRRLFFPHSLTDIRGVNPVDGLYTVEQALDILLGDLDLSGGLTESGVITISQNKRSPERKPMKRKGLFASIAAVIAGSISFQTAHAQQGVEDTQTAGLIEEILVTATRRETSLQDTPMAISAFSGDTLKTMGYTNIEEFIGSVPGVTALSYGAGATRLVIRGLSNSIFNEGNPTTSRYIDEFPINSFLGEGQKLIDMQSVEVLRGPQGTLYGKSAMGGTVRYITNKPSTEGFESGINAELSNTDEASGSNYSISAYLNLPINDKLAIRAVGYRYENKGYIDSVPITGLGMFAFLPSGAQPGEVLYPARKGINDSEYTGGRLSFRYHLSDTATLDGMWINQNLTSGGTSDTNPLTPWTGANAVDDLLSVHPYPQFSRDNDFDQYNLTLKMEFDNFDLSLSAAQTEIDSFQFNTVTLFLSEAFFGIPSFDIPAVLASRPFDFSGTTVELRLVSKGDSRLHWIAGAYYEDGDGSEELLSVNDSIRASEIFGGFFGFEVGFVGLDARVETGNEELAFYGEVGYDFSDQFTLTLGYRKADVEQFNVTTRNGGSFGNPAVVGLVNGADEDPDVYKILAEYRPAEDWLIFALATSGYRAGGKNPTVLGAQGIVYESDSLWNYELGFKSTMLDGRLTAAASIYQMDWEDMQLQVILPGGSNEIDNVGAAVIKGFEAELRWQLSGNFAVGVNFSHIDGELDEHYNPSLEPVTGVDFLVGDEGLAGDRLPGSAENTFAADIDWQQSLADNYDLYARLNYRYVGDKTIDFNPGNAVALGHPEFVSLSSYDITNFVVGITRKNNSGSTFNLALYANNLFDERAQLAYLDFYSNQVSVNQPRTIGLRAGFEF